MECCEFKTQVEALFHGISDRFTSIMKEFYEPYGLTAPQAMILIALHRGGPEKISDMAKMLGMTNSNLSVICRRLEKSGFVIRKRDEFDQRVVHLYLSDSSKLVMKEMDEHIETDYLCVLRNISSEDQEIILQGLHKLSELLCSKK